MLRVVLLSIIVLSAEVLSVIMHPLHTHLTWV
jgi:hypothetical protein